MFLLYATAAHGQVDTAKLPASNNEATSEASQAFWKGKGFYESGQFTQAQDQFQRAYQLTNDPDLLYDIAQTFRKMGQCELALRSYQDFLQLAPTSRLAPQAGKQVSDLQTACPSLHQATVPGEVPNDKDHAEPPTRLPPVSEHSPAPFPAAPRIARDQLTSFKRMRAWTYVTLAAGVAAGGTATVLELWNARRYGDWSQRNRSLAQGPVRGETNFSWLARQQDNDQLGASIQRVDRDVLFISLGAGALLATSAVLVLATSKQSSKEYAPAAGRSEVAFRPAVLGTKLVSLAMVGSF